MGMDEHEQGGERFRETLIIQRIAIGVSTLKVVWEDEELTTVTRGTEVKELFIQSVHMVKAPSEHSQPRVCFSSFFLSTHLFRQCMPAALRPRLAAWRAFYC